LYRLMSGQLAAQIDFTNRPTAARRTHDSPFPETYLLLALTNWRFSTWRSVKTT
jgi:hypothetical protein